MRTKFYYPILIIGIFMLFTSSRPEENLPEKMVLIKTKFGDMKVKLYNETPQHRDNFLKLVGEGFYNELLFHRVIKNFMVQGGDPSSKGARPGKQLGDGDLGYEIPAEFNPGLYHKKGALSAARTGDEVNPEKKSSASQFYIVQGKIWNDEMLNQFEQKFTITIDSTKREVYKTIGGTPHLDGGYTVFGEVIEGLNIIDSIANVTTQRGDRPVEDVKMWMEIIE